MNKIIFYSSSLHRKPEYAAETFIKLSGADKQVIRRAIFPEGEKHIGSIISSYNTLSSIANLKRKVTIVPTIAAENGEITMPFINGHSVERLLVESMIAGNQAEVTEIFDNVVGIVDSLPKQNVTPTADPAFSKVFGLSYSAVTDCVRPGLVDLSLDNLIVDANGEWHLFDYEWCFDFAVPLHYIVSRLFIYFFTIRYCGLILLFAERYELVKLSDFTFVPRYIYERYKDFFTRLDRLSSAEMFFQDYVHPKQSLFEPFDWGIDWYGKPTIADKSEIKNAVNNLRLLEMLDDIESHEGKNIRTIQQELSATRSELESIKSSRSYRYARRASDLRGKLKVRGKQ